MIQYRSVLSSNLLQILNHVIEIVNGLEWWWVWKDERLLNGVLVVSFLIHKQTVFQKNFLDINGTMVMKKNIENLDVDSSLNHLDGDIQKITATLVELVQDDKPWWKENLELLASQPLDSLKLHLTPFQDTSLSQWSFNVKGDETYSILDPIEALIWLVGLCRLDRILIGALPRAFVDQIELQWKVWALYWV